MEHEIADACPATHAEFAAWGRISPASPFRKTGRNSSAALDEHDDGAEAGQTIGRPHEIDAMARPRDGGNFNSPQRPRDHRLREDGIEPGLVGVPEGEVVPVVVSSTLAWFAGIARKRAVVIAMPAMAEPERPAVECRISAIYECNRNACIVLSSVVPARQWAENMHAQVHPKGQEAEPASDGVQERVAHDQRCKNRQRPARP